MLFRNTLDQVKPGIREAVEELFDAAFTNQVHPQDLLLVIEHGWYSEEVANATNPQLPKLSPYVYGPGIIGMVEDTQYKFFHNYRERVHDKNELLEAQKTHSGMFDLEEMSIHLELLIYLKFWKSDATLKKLYQLKELALRKPYDWMLDPHKFRSRQRMIGEHLRDPLQPVSPKFYALIKNIYLSQIRNAVAHSQFYFHPRSRIMHLINYDPTNHAPIKSLKFDEWEHYIHSVIMLHSELIRCSNEYNKRYKDKAVRDGGTLNILSGDGHERPLQYDPEFERWVIPQP